MEESFPRGRISRPLAFQGDTKKKDEDYHNKKEKGHSRGRRDRSHDDDDDDKTKKRPRHASDFLFGSDTKDTSRKLSPPKRGKTNSTGTSATTTTASSSNVLPLGGGGVVTSSHPRHQTKTSSFSSSSISTSRWIESLGFSKLHAGFRVLAIVRQIQPPQSDTDHDELYVFALPHQWTGYMVHKNSSNKQQRLRLSVGQVLTVTIVQAVQEPGPNGTMRRRIQVSCLPQAVNPTLEETHSSNDPQHEHGTRLRGQVQSIQDHGLIVNLGWDQVGFLSFDDIESKYQLVEHSDDDDDNDDEKESMDVDSSNTNMATEPILRLGPGSIVDVLVHRPSSSSSSKHKKKSTTRTLGSSTIVPLRLPSRKEQAHTITQLDPTKHSMQHDVHPGQLIETTVEGFAQNGLCLAFGGANKFVVFRGAVERHHLGSVLLPTSKTESQDASTGSGTFSVEKEWKSIFPVGKKILARVIAVDPSSKIVRFSLQGHLMNYHAAFSVHGSSSPPKALAMPPLGSLYSNATVLRCDPGVGALLALPPSSTNDTGDDDDEDTSSAVALHPPPSTDPRYIKGQSIQAVYVHISKAMDEYNHETTKTAKKKKSKDSQAHGLFAKTFAPSTQHNVRILANSNWFEGFASGATARSIVEAHVVSYADLVPGQLYKQVRILRGANHPNNNKRGSDSVGVVVDFGMGVGGFIPNSHLFDHQDHAAGSSSSGSHYRSQVLKVKYATNAKVTVRVLTVDVEHRRCIVTAKKSLVSAESHQIWSSYGSLRKGQTGMGVVTKLDPHKGMYVTFFNNVNGFVPIRHVRQFQQQQQASEVEEESLHNVGDVIQCRVLQIQKYQRKNQDKSGQEWNLTLGLCNPSEPEDSQNEEDATNQMKVDDDEEEETLYQQHIMKVPVQGILPSRCLRVVHVKESHEVVKNGKVIVIPGHALVEVATKHLPIQFETNKDDSDGASPVDSRRLQGLLPKSIECKLSFDQLVDKYPPEVLESASALNEFAATRLKQGQLIKAESMVLWDPKKTISDYANGMGKLTTLTLRPKFLEKAVTTAQSTHEIETSDQEGDVYVGSVLQGFVSAVDPRHGAFVQFAMTGEEDVRVTGLVPKADGGLDLSLYNTVKTRVVAIQPTVVDSNGQRRQKLLLSTSMDGKDGKKRSKSDDPVHLSVGDTVETVIVEKVSFFFASVKILDTRVTKGKAKSLHAFIHCTSVLENPPATTENATSDCMETQEEEEDRRTWHSDHPFYKWHHGLKVHNLSVASIENANDEKHHWPSDKLSRIVLVPKPNSKQTNSDTSSHEKGDKVGGIVSAVLPNGRGMRVALSPSLSTFVPAVEASDKFDVVQDLASSFTRGQLVSAHVVGQKKRKVKTGEEETLILTLLGGKANKLKRPSIIKKGNVVVGRVNRRKRLYGETAPTLVLDLPGGTIGRCCITELADPNEWVNFPLGNPLKQSPSKQPRKGRTASIDEDENSTGDVDEDHEMDDALSVTDKQR